MGKRINCAANVPKSTNRTVSNAPYINTIILVNGVPKLVESYDDVNLFVHGADDSFYFGVDDLRTFDPDEDVVVDKDVPHRLADVERMLFKLVEDLLDCPGSRIYEDDLDTGVVAWFETEKKKREMAQLERRRDVMAKLSDEDLEVLGLKRV